MTAPLLTVDDLVVEFPGRRRSTPFRALKSVSLDIKPGETVGLVGESGSGKTTLGRTILGLTPAASGDIRFEGHSILGLPRSERRRQGRDIQAVFQDPYTSLNPAMTIEDILCEPLTVQGVARREARARVAELLDAVAMPADAATRRPNEFSGGQRQRIAIARALALRPKLIICDEPVSALDLSTQSRVMDLFIDIQRRTGVAYLFVSHDLMVVRHISHRVAVMLHGEIVEFGEGGRVTSDPEHPYTRRLLAASPVSDPHEQRRRREQRLALAAQGAS